MRAVLRGAAVLVLACCAALVAVAPATADPGLVKVFVVPDPSRAGGRLPTLESIAAGTLKDPGRAGEIFGLNRGLAQPDGGALTSRDQPLHPGWILRLPPDAAGPDVKFARDNAAAERGGTPASGRSGNATAATGMTVVTIPLAAALAVVGSVLLALVTTAIVARRRVARWAAPAGRAFRALGAPLRRRRRLARRRRLGMRLASDTDAVRRAYLTIGELAGPTDRSDKPVHAVRVDHAGATVWLSAADALAVPWQSLDSTRWRRGWAPTAGPAHGTADRARPPGAARARAVQAAACLVRAGVDADSEPVFVDLSRLDGVLSVTGDPAVARDVVRHLLSEVARVRPDTPVTVLPSAAGAALLPIPAGLATIPRIPVPAPAGGSGQRGPVRGVASRRPVRGLVVMAGPPHGAGAAELTALCGPGGAGWTGLVCGPVDGDAHWRWHAGATGTVYIPVLGLELTVPA
jgi:hypothetical protein